VAPPGMWAHLQGSSTVGSLETDPAAAAPAAPWWRHPWKSDGGAPAPVAAQAAFLRGELAAVYGGSFAMTLHS